MIPTSINDPARNRSEQRAVQDPVLLGETGLLWVSREGSYDTGWYLRYLPVPSQHRRRPPGRQRTLLESPFSPRPGDLRQHLAVSMFRIRLASPPLDEGSEEGGGVGRGGEAPFGGSGCLTSSR